VSRVRNMEDFEAYVYLPADPRLIRCAQNIENAQVQALREQNERDKREMSEREQRELPFDSFSTSHDGTDGVLIGSERVPLDEFKHIEMVATRSKLSMQKVMEVLRLSEWRTIHTEPTVVPEVNLEDRLDALRKKCNKAAFRLAKDRDLDVSHVHGRFKPQHKMNQQELTAKLAQLVKEYNSP